MVRLLVIAGAAKQVLASSARGTLATLTYIKAALASAGLTFARLRKREFEMSDDIHLQQRVLDELQFDPSVKAAHIGVTVRQGVVALSGHVESYAEKYAAERAARRVRGVHAIAQDIEVRLPSDRKTADDEIAARAIKILAWDVALPPDAINVKVEHGSVLLSGTVEWAYQRADAEQDVRKLGDVTAVVNDIQVRPRVEANDVHALIRGAFERAAELDADRVTVEIQDGKVASAER
jgi:osmotically-inducible protein OsmY